MASWSQCVSIEYFWNVKGKRILLSYQYVIGGMSIEKREVLNQHLQLNITTGFVQKMPSMPQRKWAHAACLCGTDIVVTGGTSDLLLNMGMRSVPVGEPECYSYNIYENVWTQLPDVPIGKIHASLVVINNRFVFQIGGFDDYDFEIYRLDMRNPEKPWKILSLNTEKPMVDLVTYMDTQRFLELRAKQDQNLKVGEERQSEDDSDFGTI